MEHREHEHHQMSQMGSMDDTMTTKDSGKQPQHSGHGMHGMKGMNEREHHAMMIADFRRRFWVSLIRTVPILALSSVIQQFLINMEDTPNHETVYRLTYRAKHASFLAFCDSPTP